MREGDGGRHREEGILGQDNPGADRYLVTG